ncbi:MAG: helix-hairpin-helix domain-containing protein, partial [Planctomycetota bacterium]
MQKEEIVRVLREMAAILEISGRNAFRARAFANGARALDAWQGDLAALIEGGEVASVRGIGKGLTRVIADLVTAGESPEHLALRASIPSTLLDLLAIQGLGPKKVKALHEALGITGIDDLEDACRAEQVRARRGFGERSESEILAGLERARRWGRRHTLPEAEAVAERLAAAVASAAGVGRIAVAGSLRRRLETVGDIDLLAVAEDPAAARAAFLAVPGIDHAEAEGDKRCRVVLEGGIGVDLRLVDEAAFPAALHHFTGSKSHNTHLRSLARQRGWKLNEYGLWDERGEALPIDAEGDIFRHLGLAWIPPELREDRGGGELAPPGAGR